MNCLHPVRLATPEKILKDPLSWMYKNGIAYPPPRFMYVPCGHCLSCFRMRRLNWVLRMEKELEVATSCYFVTCTYADEHLPRTASGLPTLSVRDHQLFMKRLRKVSLNTNLRFFMCGEYGSNFDRPHFHYVFFNLCHDYMTGAVLVQTDPDVYRSSQLEDVWQKGHVQIGPINPGGMSYVAKYCQWREEGDISLYDVEQVKPFCIMSRRPAIGANYLDKDWRQPFMYREGHLVPVPRYYRDKMQLDKDYSFLYERPEAIKLSMREFKDKMFYEKLYFNDQKSRKKDLAGLSD